MNLASILRWPKGFYQFVSRVVRKRPKTSLAVLLIFSMLYLFIWYLRQPAPPEYITEMSTRGDLRQVVEAVGEVISEKDIKLQFPITGIVYQVNVGEGDVVTKGQELARLRSSGLAADVNSAAAQVASAQADLRELMEGTRPEEIAIREASVLNKKASLEAARESLNTSERTLEISQRKLEILQDEARVSLDGYISTAKSSASQNLSIALTAINSLDDVLNNVDLQDGFIKYAPHEYQSILNNLKSANSLINADLDRISTVRDYHDAISVLALSRDNVAALGSTLNQTYSTVSSLPISPSLSNADRESSKSDIATQRTNAQTAQSALESAHKTMRDAAAGFDTKIAAEEKTVIAAEGARDEAIAAIRTYETSLRTEEAEMALLRAGARQTDIDSARARVNQYYAQLQRARERFEDTVIKAPLDGTITQVNLKEGELLSTSFASDAAITMLGVSPYRIVLYVAEIDIPKVQLTQTGAIEVDAFPNEKFLLTVSEIDPAATDRDGVSKYRAKLDFVDQGDMLKIGMTGDAEIYTDSREDIIIIPGRAVITGDEGQDAVRILAEDSEIEERDVTIGMDGEGGSVEVISGVKEGETVVVLIKK